MQHPFAWILDFRVNCRTSCDLSSNCISVESRPATGFEDATHARQQERYCVGDVVQMYCLSGFAPCSEETMFPRRSQDQAMKARPQVAFFDSYFFVVFFFQRLLS